MTNKQLLRRISYYGITIDKATRKYISERLRSIEKNGMVYSFEEMIPYGSRAYKGSKVYRAYDQVMQAIENRRLLKLEQRDIKKNLSNWASDDDIARLFGRAA